MELTAEQLPDGIEKISLAGRMDSAGTQELDLRFTALVSTRPGLFVIDMAQVSFLASIGIRTLLSNARALAMRGGRMVIAAPQPMVGDVLKLAGIDSLIPTFPDLATACTGLKAPAPTV